VGIISALDASSLASLDTTEINANRNRVIDLTFHGVGNPGRELEPNEHAVWIKREMFTAILDTAIDRNDVVLTFDDGNDSDVEYALPALLERGLRATFFIVAERVGERGFLDRNALRELASAGMLIGSHGLRHRPWRRLSDDERYEEFVEARRFLELLVGRPVIDAACPYGAYDRRTLAGLRREGYRRVFTSDGGCADRTAWLQPRNSLVNGVSEDCIERIAAAEQSRFGRAVRASKRMVKRWR
jgi:peptidoglycan/xylan/chitin deacetylase (PgdA/CDA1 family)